MITYVINLDRSPERWTYMEAMCRGRGLTVRRVPAVDGNDLPRSDFDRLNPVEPGRRRLSRTEVACCQSHRRVWEQVAGGSESVALVLEDDVFLAENSKHAVEAIAQACPEADLIKLNNYRKPIYLCRQPLARVAGYSVHRLPARTIDASAYLICRRAAEKLLRLFPPFPRELDVMLFDPENGLVAAQVVPALSVQEKFADFSFLCPEGSQSLLEATRTEENARRKAQRPRTLRAKLGAELRRFGRRRVAPRLLFLTNLFRPADRRLFVRAVAYKSSGAGMALHSEADRAGAGK